MSLPAPVRGRVPSRPSRRTCALLVVALAACGEPATAPLAHPATKRAPAPVAPAPTEPTAPTGTTVTGCTGTVLTLSADEARSLTLHNQQRSSGGLPALCVHPALLAAARAHAQDMLAQGYFSHTSLDGRTLVTRVNAAGYAGWTMLAENIAWGSGTYGDPDRIFANWMNSSGHRANILNGGLREVGIGVATGTFQGYAGARMYVADFGTR